MAEPEYSRTEQATPHKRTEARNKGQVARSLDFNTLVIMFSAPHALNELANACKVLFVAAADGGSTLTLASALHEFVRSLTSVMLPIMIVAMLLAVVANVVQTGLILSSEPVKPQLTRLNPVAGFKRIYNRRVLVEGMKAILKLCVFAAIAVSFFRSIWPSVPDLLDGDVPEQVGWFASHAKTLALRLVLALLVIGLLDILWSRWQYAKQLMMSRREMQEEVKRREGDPLIRHRLRELQRENLKQTRALGRVSEADVLITNPTHVAVALAYDRTTMLAPMVIARGADLWAAQMKAKARRHGVVILERRSLAQRLYRQGIVDQPIPQETYIDVARVYADLSRARATLVSGEPAARQAGHPR
jgi:flagellar biosynthesis protein FlhB